MLFSGTAGSGEVGCDDGRDDGGERGKGSGGGKSLGFSTAEGEVMGGTEGGGGRRDGKDDDDDDDGGGAFEGGGSFISATLRGVCFSLFFDSSSTFRADTTDL